MNILLLLMTGTLNHQQWQTIAMLLGPNFIDGKWSRSPCMDHRELPGLHQRRFVQHYVEVNHDNYLIIMEAYCLHTITHGDGQALIIFCHTWAHYEVMHQQLINMVRKRLRKMPTQNFRDRPSISFQSGHPTAYPDINENILTGLIKDGNEIRIAFNHAKYNRKYNDLVTQSVQTSDNSWHRIVACTSTYTACINLYGFAHVFITNNKDLFVGGIGRGKCDGHSIDNI
jgi:hypothetical protein